MFLSVVIPALNEAEQLPETILRARAVPETGEIIVVDGGSQDATTAVAREHGCRVLNTPPGRGGQLRAGAKEAQGEVILLLHADTWLPANAGNAIRRCLEDPRVVAGAFWKTFRRPVPWLMRGARLKCGFRFYCGGMILGDQAMFVRRSVLEQIGGIPEVPLMEEFELCRKLRPLGKLALADATVSTSARRFQERGVLRTYWRMWNVALRYQLGATPEELKRLYERK